MNPPKLIDLFPDFTEEVRGLLKDPTLATQLDDLRIVCRCPCKDSFCASLYFVDPPKGAWPSPHRSLDLGSKNGTLILDVVGEKITFLEILYRQDVFDRLKGAQWSPGK